MSMKAFCSPILDRDNYKTDECLIRDCERLEIINPKNKNFSPFKMLFNFKLSSAMLKYHFKLFVLTPFFLAVEFALTLDEEMER
jgi:hypothetical protein